MNLPFTQEQFMGVFDVKEDFGLLLAGVIGTLMIYLRDRQTKNIKQNLEVEHANR